MTKFEIKCVDTAATEAFGERLGRGLHGGELIELIGDLGAGKTTFTRGVARGLDSKDQVSSPTFTIHKVYGGRLTLHHFDFYRLDDSAAIKHELGEILANPQAVTVLEWAQNVAGCLEENHITLELQPTSETGRKIIVSMPLALGYLEETLC